MVVAQNLFLLVSGFILLILSGDKLVENAARLAQRFSIPSSVIAVTLIAAGTSAPELVTSFLAAFQGTSDISVGNVIGSNTFNILAIGGLSIFIRPTGGMKNAFFSWPVLILASLIFTYFLRDFAFSRTEGILMVIGLNSFLVYSLFQKSEDPELYLGRKMSLVRLITFTILSLGGLLLGAELALSGGEQLGRMAGLSERIIGITIISVGTGLPELATSLAASARGRNDMAIANILGSNIFNTLGIPGITAAFFPLAVDPKLFEFDAVVMLLATLSIGFCFFVRAGFGQRLLGITFMAAYVAYVAKLILGM